MQCPSCENQKLIRSKYNGANVHECPACFGFLLDQDRAEKLERRVNKDVDQLKKEVLQSEAADTASEIRCPACRDRMKKRHMESLAFHVDECNQCDRVWLDGGELATLQLAFETTPQRVEVNKMRERLENMTPAERAEYEARIAALPDLGSPFEQVVLGAAAGVSRKYYRSR